MYYAHTGKDLSDSSTWQTLEDHLSEVSRLASEFAGKFGMAEWGCALGTLHDAGKASGAFQQHLAGDTNTVDHSTAGAKEAVARYGPYGMLMAYAIAGHHGGQPNGVGNSDPSDSSARTPLKQRLEKELQSYDGFLDLLASGCLALPRQEDLPLPIIPGRVHGIDDPETPNFFSFYVLARMLYSCLVDADGLDTERIMAPEALQVRQGREYASLDKLYQKLQDHLANMHAPDTAVNRARASVLADCLEAAVSDQGLFTLTVPTGGGKTFGALSFALKHALSHGMDRIIIAAPFTTIISQTASKLKEIFGSQNVMEHCSSYSFSDLDEEESYAARLAVQNWDAPIIVTTNVQLLESLFSNKPGKSRKVHNIANSVIILDEAQTLPDSLLVPSLAMFEELSFAYNTSIILCSATQPALEMRWPYGSHPQNIVAHPECLANAFDSRIQFEMLGIVELRDLAHTLGGAAQALCVVGTKGNALAVYLAVIEDAIQRGTIKNREQAATEGFFHLSAFMTPAHRDEIIVDIRDRLKKKKRCIVISTQLIEAGVDIDFPELYREVAGMDSIVQAAGRCNREGAPEPGQVRIFDLSIDGERGGTSPWLDKMRNISLDLIAENGGIIEESLVHPFFERRYQSEETDEEGIFKALSDISILEQGFATIPFERVALDYRIIKDDTVSLFIPRGEEGRALLKELYASETSAMLAMRIQRHCVSVPRWLALQYQKPEVAESFGLFLVLREEYVPFYYKADVGLLKPGEEEPEFLFL